MMVGTVSSSSKKNNRSTARLGPRQVHRPYGYRLTLLWLEIRHLRLILEQLTLVEAKCFGASEIHSGYERSRRCTGMERAHSGIGAPDCLSGDMRDRSGRK